MPRAHRWTPDAIVAISSSSSSSQSDGKIEQGLPTVVFCPLAAKGSQNAAVERKQQQQNQAQQLVMSEAQEQQPEEKTNNDDHEDEASSSQQQKQSKNKRNAQDIVSATAFWLVDPNINRVIGRLEKEGLVNVLEHYLNNDDRGKKLLQPNHLKSHSEYSAMMVENLQTEGQRNFYLNEFVTNPNEEKRKFGNMAVGGVTDVKCAHALSAQYLANVTCPLGELVVKFILFVAKKTDEDDESGSDDDDGANGDKQKKDKPQQKAEKEKKNDDDESGNDLAKKKDWRQNLIPLFRKFVDAILDKGEEISGKFVSSAGSVCHQSTAIKSKLVTNDATEVVESAKRILKAFVEKGEGSGRRRKRRTD